MRCFWSPKIWRDSVLTGCILGMACRQAFAIGTWYTSKVAWLSAVTSVRADTFADSLGRGRILNRLGGDLKIWETGDPGSFLYRGINDAGERFISVNQCSNVMNLSFNSFAFSGYFGVVDEGDCLLGSSLMITTSDGTQQTLDVSSGGGTFLGYVGDIPITWMTIEQPDASGYVALNSFSLAKPAGDLAVTGANVAPEPGSRELLIFGSGIGLASIVWKRKRLFSLGKTPCHIHADGH